MYSLYEKIRDFLIVVTLFLFPVGALVCNWYRIGMLGGIQTQGAYRYGIEFHSELYAFLYGTVLVHTIGPIFAGLIAWGILCAFLWLLGEGTGWILHKILD